MARRSPAPPALVAAFLAVALICAGVADRLHRQERHVRCPEHGELMHVADGGSDAPLASLRANESQGGHEDCELGALSSQRGLLLPQVAEASPVLALATTPVLREAPRASSRPLFWLAPKSSPPV